MDCFRRNIPLHVHYSLSCSRFKHLPRATLRLSAIPPAPQAAESLLYVRLLLLLSPRTLLGLYACTLRILRLAIASTLRFATHQSQPPCSSLGSCRNSCDITAVSCNLITLSAASSGSIAPRTPPKIDRSIIMRVREWVIACLGITRDLLYADH